MTCVLLVVAACPTCPPNVEARALVLSEAFWMNLGATLLPLVVVGLVVHAFTRRLDRSRDDRSRDDE